MQQQKNKQSNKESGNVLVIILLAVVLIGALTAAIQGTSQHGANIDKETLILRATELQQQAAEFERGITFIMQNGFSEVDIRFSHPDAHADYGDLGADTDKSDQLFAREGGGSYYRTPPEDINDGSAWEFYGNTAFPDVGSASAELIAILPNVTQEFCLKINEIIGYDATQPTDTVACLYDGAVSRFDAGTQFSSSPNTVDPTSFSLKPSMQACIQCSSDSSYHFYHVLMAR